MQFHPRQSLHHKVPSMEVACGYSNKAAPKQESENDICNKKLAKLITFSKPYPA